HFLGPQHAQVCEPAAKTKEWIVIRTAVFRFGLPSSGAIENVAHRHAINGRGSDAEPNDSTSEDVHDQHHPMAPHEDRFNAEQIDTPDAVLGVSDESYRERGWCGWAGNARGDLPPISG